MIKGIEALLTESLLAARHYGVESTVLASLRDLFPSEDRPRISQYMISRSLNTVVAAPRKCEKLHAPSPTRDWTRG
jgi:hypothetical protein